jgi:hypothetical protein
MLDSMFRGSRAPWSRSEDRCDGAGSEADGAKPPVKPGPMLPVPGVSVFDGATALVNFRSSGLRIDTARRWPGCFCAAYRIVFLPPADDGAPIGDRAALSGRVRWKFFIHWLFARGAAGWRVVLGFAGLGRDSQAVTVR